MSSLREALKDNGMTQAALAEELGVTDAAVNHWVQGKRPIPEDRLPQIEMLLKVDLSEAVVDYGKLLEAGRTPVGYAILWPLRCPLDTKHFTEAAPRSAEDFKRRLSVWSTELGISRGLLEQAILGTALLPLAAVEKLGELVTHVHNPGIMASQVGFKQAEVDALIDALEAPEGWEDFDAALKALTLAKQAWLEQGLTADEARAKRVLDNGNTNDDIQWWLDGKDGPDIVKADSARQTLAGRFQSV